MLAASTTTTGSSRAQTSAAEWRTWRQFVAMRRRLDRELERRLQRDANISGPDYEILVSLFETPERRLRVMELGEILGWEKSRVSHQLTRMEKRGLVKRVECTTDARGTWVIITVDGSRTILGAIREHAAAVRRVFFDVLNAEEQLALHSISARVLEAIDAPSAAATSARSKRTP